MKLMKPNHLLILAVSLLFISLTAAQPLKGQRQERLKEKLNLTETQENQIETLRSDHQKNMVDLRASLQKAQIEAKEILNKDEINRNDYLAVQKKINTMQNEIEIARANHLMDVLQLLDKDQRKTFLESERMLKRKMKMHQRKR